ncbi:MAG: DNA methyltransferase [Nitrososphaeraceae archaeon]
MSKSTQNVKFYLNQAIDDVTFKPNTIYCGDCKDVLRHFPEYSIDLIYLDPPFFSNRHFEVIWKDGYELRSFEDRWKGGIHNYIGWMEERLWLCQRVLKPNGSIFLHCDWHAGHYLKVLMDKIFGYERFLNEIVWCFETSGKYKSHFSRKHNTIFWYSKGKEYTFNSKAVSIPRKPDKHMRMGIDADGRRYEEKTDSKTGKVYRWYFDEGRLPLDYWTDIQFINREAKERLGYPTQKPEALVERIIKAASNPNDIVLDPFCGCRIAIAVAERLGRRWIGIDVSPTACKLMQKRMRVINGKNTEIIGLPLTVEELKLLHYFEFQNWVMDKLYARINPKRVGEMGIDGYFMDSTPIQVKQSEGIGRNVVDNFETAIQRKGRKKGMIVAFSFGRGAHEEVARIKQEQGLEIILKTVKDTLDES